jgi:hypothetical protein
MLEEVVLVTRKKNRPVTEEAISMRTIRTPNVVWLKNDRNLGIEVAASRDSFFFERVSEPSGWPASNLH